MKDNAKIVMVWVILGFTCPLIAAIMLQSGWYLAGWLLLTGISVNDTK